MTEFTDKIDARREASLRVPNAIKFTITRREYLRYLHDKAPVISEERRGDLIYLEHRHVHHKGHHGKGATCPAYCHEHATLSHIHIHEAHDE